MTDPETPLPTLRTERLTLVALTPAAYTAWAAGDAAALSAATGVPFADAEAPQLLGEDLPKIRDLALARWDPNAIGWWGWLATLTATGDPVGSVGFAGRPDDGVATIATRCTNVTRARGPAPRPPPPR